MKNRFALSRFAAVEVGGKAANFAQGKFYTVFGFAREAGKAHEG